MHDGATIIRGNMILSSSVFYQPTQRPLNGKYGSRHRAAIGISKESDSIAIIVSEETGKVSVAKDGTLIADVREDVLKKIFMYFVNVFQMVQ